MSAQARTRPAERHADGLSGLRRKRARVRELEALRAAWGEVLRKVRWHLRQRRPRPARDSAIDHLIAAGKTLVLIAVIIAIGG